MDNVTEEQFKKLIEALDIELEGKRKPKRYEVLSTKYCTGKKRDELWESLVELGLADSAYDKGYWYSVSKDGMKFVGDKLGAEIVELK